MNLGTLTQHSTYSAEPGQDTCLQVVASFECSMSWEQGALPCEGHAPLRTDTACIVPWQSRD